MRNTIAGAVLIFASVIFAVMSLYGMTMFGAIYPGTITGSESMSVMITFLAIPIVGWLVYFIPGLYYLFLATRDKQNQPTP